MTLHIAKSDYEQLRRHGEQTYPDECCGVLLGQIQQNGIKSVASAVPCQNQRSDSPQNRYFIDPRELLHIQRDARQRELDIVGFYHSHPDHPARWSATDLAEAYWTGCSYIITSVMNGAATETNSFELQGDGDSKCFRDERISLE